MALVKILNCGFNIEVDRDTIVNEFDSDSHTSNFIKGRVLFHPKIRTLLNELVLTVEGVYSVHSFHAYRTIEKTIIKQKLILSEQNDKGILLPPTCHEYPFELNIPGGLPQSFKGEFGRVSYKITAIGTLSGRWTMAYIKAERDLYIFRDMSPLYDTFRRKLSGTWMNSVSYNITLPKCGFVPGDTIPISFQYHVSNAKMNLTHMIGFLRENCMYRMPSDDIASGSIIREDQETLDYCGNYDQVEKDGVWKMYLKIPNTLTSFSCVSEYTQIVHKVSFHIEINNGGVLETFTLSLPIFILPSDFTKHSTDTTFDDVLPSYDIIPPPPSYSEVIVS
ncbi:hypothetical protein K7432_002306 [Basidiobolus ranarum]|uniref:Arrestin C-terminal-like domain-containing protein n=1 Tax=Basidiobolus ranarum TaxID=34480 RepID=A0ABR2W831_9FUNG